VTDQAVSSASERRPGRRVGVSWLLLTLVALAAASPLLLGRVLGGDDIVVYLINAQQMAANLRAGELFPAWAGGFNAGFGAPTLLVFPPLTTYLHALPVLVGVPVALGVAAWSLVGLLLSGGAMWCWLGSSGDRRAALAASVLYMVAPYRLFDLFTRSALAEHWSFVWPPLILWAATSQRVPAVARAALVALGVTALLLSNIPLAVLFGLGLAVWFVLAPQLQGRRLAVLGGVGLGFGIAAFSLVPQAMSSSLLAVEHHYGAGAGNFRPSANTLFSGDFNTRVSMIVVATTLLVIVAYLLLSPRVRSSLGARAMVVAAVGCGLATTAPAGALWDALPVLSRFQFPWRVASLLTFALAWFVARLEGRRAVRLAAVVVVVASVPFLGWGSTVPLASFHGPQPPRPPTGSVFPDPYAAWEAGSVGWYWRHANLAEVWFVAHNAKPFLLAEMVGNPAPELDPIRGRPAVLLEDRSSAVRVRSWGPVQREVEIDCRVPGTLLWRCVSFPAMTVSVDGRPVVASTDEATGLVAHAIQQGRHRVLWAWRPFPALRWARAATLLGLAAVAILLMAGLWRARASGTAG
jgi:hypothetical protein